MPDSDGRRLTQQPDFREFVNHLEGVIAWVGDADGFSYVSAGYEDIVGRPVEHIYESDPSVILEDVHPDDVDRVAAMLERVANLNGQAELDPIEYRIIRPDGETRWVEVRAFPIHDGGAVSEIIGVTIDITERKRAELELERQNERLEQFASVVSHDLRNPLNVADGRLVLLRELTDLDSAAEAELDAIERAHDRMERIVEDLLWLAREGRDIGTQTTVPLERAVESAWQFVETGDATLVTDCDVQVIADVDRLRQLFENLMRNCVEHGRSDATPPTVRVGTIDDGFYLEDDGPGIPADERDAVFEPGSSSAPGGTGFGLSIVMTIASAHGWTLDIAESDAGGARFEFTGVEFA